MNILLKFNRDTTTKSLGKRMKKMHPRKLTWNLKITCLKRKVMFQTFIVGFHVGVSKNSGIPKASNLIGFSIINHPFLGTPIHGNTHVHFQGSACPFQHGPFWPPGNPNQPDLPCCCRNNPEPGSEAGREGLLHHGEITFWTQKWRFGWWFSLPFSIIYTHISP